MKPEKVSVVDERGKLLSRNGDEYAAQTGELLELKAKIEKEIESRIENMLAKIVGPNKVIAKVDAQLSSRSLQAVEELLDPDNVVIRSQQTQEESLDGARVNPSGIPGARANLPGAEQAGQVSFKQDVKKEIKTTNFEIPKTVRNIRELAGQLERLSVAVIVDGVYAPSQSAEGQVQNTWTPRSAEELARYEGLVKNAIGFNQKRGDQVTIESIQFVHEDFSESERLLTTLERKQLLQGFLKWSLILISLSLFFFLVVRPFIQWIGDSFQESVEEMLPRTIEELEELHSVDSTLPGLSSSLPVLEESIDPDKAEAELLRDRIMALMEQDEEKASNAFGMWLVKKESDYGVRS
jgi:flagellar M-ring protein FliF